MSRQPEDIVDESQFEVDPPQAVQPSVELDGESDDHIMRGLD